MSLGTILLIVLILLLLVKPDALVASSQHQPALRYPTGEDMTTGAAPRRF